MRKVAVFNNITLDGFFTDTKNHMSLFHRENDAEWNRFASQNAASRRSTLLFGRKTYELMKSYWPTDEAKQRMPEVAAGMEAMEKVVFSHSLKEPGWKNVRIVSGDLVTEVRKLKEGTGDQMLIMGSGSIVSQLTKARLIDSYTMVIWPTSNQNYGGYSQLYTPVAEAGAMKTELASRGYDASVHEDQTSGGMDSLWGSMVGAANPGDQLVAFYGGHGTSEGLLGVEHDAPPSPPDIFTNQQVAGMVSAATGKNAHIRMIMDSCHSGTAVQAVRQIRENELAATARSAGDQLRVAAMLGLRQAKQRLLDLIERRADIVLASYRETREHGRGDHLYGLFWKIPKRPRGLVPPKVDFLQDDAARIPAIVAEHRGASYTAIEWQFKPRS